jgi:hypothetical protein
MTAGPFFFRSGAPVREGGPAVRGGPGKEFCTVTKVCGRCGGQGGAEQWRHTGWTCFDCAGRGTRGLEDLRVYTAERLAKLNASAAKAAAKREAAAVAKQAAADAAAELRRAEFIRVHGALLERAAVYAGRSDFLADVIARAERTCALSDGQVTAILNTLAKFGASEAARERRAAAGHLGTVGERLTFAATVKRSVGGGGREFGTFPWRITTLEDEAGRCIVYKGTAHYWEPGTVVTLKATIKEHGDYQGTPQTMIARPVVVSETAPADAEAEQHA